MCYRSHRAPEATKEAMLAKACAFMVAARRWAERARDVTLVMAGRDSPAYKVWTKAVHAEHGCWLASGVRGPSPPFARLWMDAGLAERTPMGLE